MEVNIVQLTYWVKKRHIIINYKNQHMTITKKLLQTTITILAIAGMVLMSTPASAGFFDWFGATPLSQEAQSVKSLSSQNLLDSNISSQNSNIPVIGNGTPQIQAQQKTPATKKGFFGFLQSIFSSNSSTPNPVVGTETTNISDLTLIPACGPNTEPWIQVLSPNGGEVYNAGDHVTVKWESCNPIDPQVMIILKSTQTNFGAEIASVSDTGIATIVLPSALGPFQEPVISGSYYKILLQLGGNAMGYSAPTDISDNVFNISNRPTITSQNAQSCDLSENQIGAVLSLMNSFGATEQAVIAVKNVLLYGETSVVMTQASGLSQIQIDAIMGLLESFGCGTDVTYLVNDFLSYGSGSVISSQVCDTNTAPYVKLLSPLINGGGHGGIFAAGESILVEWETCNVPPESRVQVGLIDSVTFGQNQFITNITGPQGTANDGEEWITLQSLNGTEKARLMINIVLPDNLNWIPQTDKIIYDFSDGYGEFDL